MVLKKRQEYGFYGYQVPVFPRAPRSLRRRSLIKRYVDDDQICAFELLATVAGKLLQESESSASSNALEGKEQLGICKDGIKMEQLDGKAARSDCVDRGSCIESVPVPESERELPLVESDSTFERTSVVTSSDLSKKTDCNVKFEKYMSNNAGGIIPGKSQGHLGDEGEKQVEVVGKEAVHLNVANTSNSDYPMALDVNNTHILINSGSSIKFPLYRDYVPKASFPRHRNDVKVVNRDDDENYFRCNQQNTKIRAFRPQSRNGYRRIRKLMTSRYWKAAPKLKDYELSNTGRGGRPFYHKRKTIYARDRYPHEVPSKRRRLFDQRSTIVYDQEASSESISNSPMKAVKGGNCGTPAFVHRATAPSSSNSVKFSIKSFKVPELYIEVPETATVGSLKRTVMEAVTAILEGGLCVGVVLQGKKVRDDNRTLQQTGISQNKDLDTLGFTLEPNFVQAACDKISHKDPPLLLPCDTHKPLSRSPVPVLDSSGLSNSSLDQAAVTNLDNLVESNHEIVPFVSDASADGTVPDSKALVAIPPMNMEPLAMVPMNQKAKRSELSQRRTRRPFSVSEVEALVEAVEKLGTGRWRDVKIRAFDDANHRTYVDLKDKWKTLVHTASIAPQQRRGEPVPQELLDRVLSAHAYWSQHQSKQHGKHQIEPPPKLAGEIGV